MRQTAWLLERSHGRINAVSYAFRCAPVNKSNLRSEICTLGLCLGVTNLKIKCILSKPDYNFKIHDSYALKYYH